MSKKMKEYSQFKLCCECQWQVASNTADIGLKVCEKCRKESKGVPGSDTYKPFWKPRKE